MWSLLAHQHIPAKTASHHHQHQHQPHQGLKYDTRCCFSVDKLASNFNVNRRNARRTCLHQRVAARNLRPTVLADTSLLSLVYVPPAPHSFKCLLIMLPWLRPFFLPSFAVFFCFYFCFCFALFLVYIVSISSPCFFCV